jgi:hypothetical protein
MDVVDASLFALLAVADLVLIVLLRGRRSRRLRSERLAQCLAEAVRRELQLPVRRRAVLRQPAVGRELISNAQ